MPFLLDSPEAVAAARLSASHNPEAFWADIAGHYDWMKPWNNVCSAEFETPSVRWFEGAELNITANCLDRHLAEHGDQTAILWEPNDPADSTVAITYAELHDRVCRFANVLKSRGVGKGDRVALCLPIRSSWQVPSTSSYCLRPRGRHPAPTSYRIRRASTSQLAHPQTFQLQTNNSNEMRRRNLGLEPQ